MGYQINDDVWKRIMERTSVVELAEHFQLKSRAAVYFWRQPDRGIPYERALALSELIGLSVDEIIQDRKKYVKSG